MAALASASPAQASTVITAAFPSFTSTNIKAFNLNGNAYLNGSVLTLTQASGGEAGTAWWLNKVYLGSDRSFSACFSFHMSSLGNGGADGITFCVQPSSNSALSSGGGLGYAGITPSFAVELDTYQNTDYGDPNANHIGIDLNGSVSSVETATPPWTMNNGAIYYVWVDYDGATNDLEIRLNNSETRPASALLSDTINLSQNIGQQAYVGFTGSTGGSWEEHDIDGLYFNNAYTPLDPVNQAYVTAATAVSLRAASSHVLPGDATTVTATATDPSGNPVSGQVVTFSATGGSVSPLTATTDSNGSATATFTAGASDTAATVTVEAQGGAYGTANVIVDGTAPVTTATGLATSNNSAWHAAAASFTLSATDATPASGVAATYYTIDAGGARLYTGTPVVVSGDASHVVTYWSVDAVGNTERPHTAYMNIDSAAPSAISGLASSTHPTQTAWYANNTPAFSWSAASDATSGLAGYSYVLDQTSGTIPSTTVNTTATAVSFPSHADGTWYFHLRAVDGAGNGGATIQYAVNIDVTPPQTSDDSPSASHVAPATITLTPTDSGSGMSGGDATTAYRIEPATTYTSGTSVSLPTPGTYTVDYRSTDAAGNQESERSFTVTVRAPIPPLSSSSYGFADAAGSLWQSSAQTVTITAAGGDGTGRTIHYSTDGGTTWTALAGDSADVQLDGDGSYHVEYYASDSLATEAIHDAGYVNIDVTPPQTGAAGLVAGGDSGWSTGPVTVTLKPSDAGSGVAVTYYTIDGTRHTYSGPFEVSAEGSHAVTYWSVDALGNTESPSSGYVNIDGTPPQTGAAGLAANAHSGWSTGPVTVTLKPSDTGSGVAVTYYTIDGIQHTYSGPFEVSAEGSHAVTYWSVDTAGNQEQAGAGYVNIDSTPPQTGAAGLVASARSGWSTGLVTVTLKPSDAGCGVQATYYTIDGGGQQSYTGPFQISGEGSHAVTYWSVDALGNTERPHTAYANIAAPDAVVTKASGVSADELSDWTDATRTVTLVPSGGFGTLTTYYCLDGGPRQTYSGPFPVGGEGCHTLTYWSVDSLGDSGSADRGFVNIDTTPPTTTAHAQTGWMSSTVVIPLKAADTGSGVAATHYRIDGGALKTGTTVILVVRADHRTDGRHTITYYSVDRAANVEATHTLIVGIDTTRPRLRMTPLFVTARRGALTRIRVRVTDNLSATCALKLAVTQYGTAKTRILPIGVRRCGRWFVASFRFKLSEHCYNLHAVARDWAGNRGHTSGFLRLRGAATRRRAR